MSIHLRVIAAAMWMLATGSISAQGTIQFLNSAFSKLSYAAAPDAVVRDAPIGTVVGLFWGASSNALTLQTPAIPIHSTPGLFNSGSVYAIPGANPGQQVYVKFAAWFNSEGSTPAAAPQGAASPGITHYGESIVVLTTPLGSVVGPGTVVWQSRNGTNPNRARPFTMERIPAGVSITRNALTANLTVIEVTGVTGLNYAIQASTNLNASQWGSLATNGAPYTYVDAASSFHARRFYRAVVVP